MGLRPSLITLCLAACVLATPGCATNPVTGNSELVLMSESQELEIGRELHQQVIGSLPLSRDDALQRYVQAVGDRVAAQSHRSDLIYRFFVLDLPEVNAFALPGGYIYIYRGLLGWLNSEAELAAVLGHEIGHVTGRHAVRQQRNATLTGILGTVVAVQAGGGQAFDIANLLGTAMVRGYGRDMELEADRLGAEYLARSGFDPQAMLGVIGVLKDQETWARQRAEAEGREVETYHGVFSTHPRNDERLKEVVNAAQSLRPPTEARIGRASYLERIDGMTWGPAEDQGVQRGREFLHKDLDFAFTLPTGWQLKNLPDRVVAIAPSGAEQTVMQMQDMNRRLSPEAFARQRLRIKKDVQAVSFDAAGLPGWRALLKRSDLFSTEYAQIAVIRHGDRAFIFSGQAPDPSDPHFSDGFVNLVRSFRPLSADELPMARAIRIHTQRFGENESWASIARRQPLEQDSETVLRLLNSAWPDGAAVPGQEIKVLR